MVCESEAKKLIEGSGFCSQCIVTGGQAADDCIVSSLRPSVGRRPSWDRYLGEDVLSRFLPGGLVIALVAIAAVVMAYAVGAPLGLWAGFRGGRVDFIVSSVLNVVLAIPPFVLALVLVAGLGSVVTGTTIAIAAVLVAPCLGSLRPSATSSGARCIPTQPC